MSKLNLNSAVASSDVLLPIGVDCVKAIGFQVSSVWHLCRFELVAYCNGRELLDSICIVMNKDSVIDNIIHFHGEGVEVLELRPDAERSVILETYRNIECHDELVSEVLGIVFRCGEESHSLVNVEDEYGLPSLRYTSGEASFRLPL